MNKLLSFNWFSSLTRTAICSLLLIGSLAHADLVKDLKRYKDLSTKLVEAQQLAKKSGKPLENAPVKTGLVEKKPADQVSAELSALSLHISKASLKTSLPNDVSDFIDQAKDEEALFSILSQSCPGRFGPAGDFAKYDTPEGYCRAAKIALDEEYFAYKDSLKVSGFQKLQRKLGRDPIRILHEWRKDVHKASNRRILKNDRFDEACAKWKEASELLQKKINPVTIGRSRSGASDGKVDEAAVKELEAQERVAYNALMNEHAAVSNAYSKTTDGLIDTLKKGPKEICGILEPVTASCSNQPAPSMGAAVKAPKAVNCKLILPLPGHFNFQKALRAKKADEKKLIASYPPTLKDPEGGKCPDGYVFIDQHLEAIALSSDSPVRAAFSDVKKRESFSATKCFSTAFISNLVTIFTTDSSSGENVDPSVYFSLFLNLEMNRGEPCQNESIQLPDQATEYNITCLKNGDALIDIKKLKGKGSFKIVGSQLVYHRASLDQLAAEHKPVLEVKAIGKPLDKESSQYAAADFKDEFNKTERIRKGIKQGVISSVGLILPELLTDADGRTYLQSDPYEGDSYQVFEDLKAKGRFKISEQLEAIHEGVKGVVSLHKLHLFHRDIKLQNLLVKGYQNPRPGQEKKSGIIDYGLMIDLDTINLRSDRSYPQTAGTLPYMPPEAFFRQWGDGPRSAQDARILKGDVYAFGVCLNDLLYGNHATFEIAQLCMRQPYAHIKMCFEQNLNKFREQRLKDVPAGSEDSLVLLLADSIHPDPDMRPSIEEFQKRLEKLKPKVH